MWNDRPGGAHGEAGAGALAGAGASNGAALGLALVQGQRDGSRDRRGAGGVRAAGRVRARGRGGDPTHRAPPAACRAAPSVYVYYSTHIIPFASNRCTPPSP